MMCTVLDDCKCTVYTMCRVLDDVYSVYNVYSVVGVYSNRCRRSPGCCQVEGETAVVSWQCKTTHYTIMVGRQTRSFNLVKGGQVQVPQNPRFDFDYAKHQTHRGSPTSTTTKKISNGKEMGGFGIKA